MFLFPESKFDRALNIFKSHGGFTDDPIGINIMRTMEAKNKFNYQSRRVFGMNYFMSFIPGTSAYQARANFNVQLEITLEDAHAKLKQLSDVDTFNFFERLSMHTQLRGPIISLLLLSPLWEILNAAFSKISTFTIFDNVHHSVLLILANFPIISDFSGNNKLENFLHSLLNPARYISQALNFIQLATNGIFEIGSNSENSNFLVAGLKLLTSISFAIAALPVKTLEIVFDLPYQVLKHAVFNPLRFITNSVTQFCLGHDPGAKISIDKLTVKPQDIKFDFSSSYNKMNFILTNENFNYNDTQVKNNDTSFDGINYSNSDNNSTNNNFTCDPDDETIVSHDNNDAAYPPNLDSNNNKSLISPSLTGKNRI